jgi:hypothetical protein
LCLPDECNVCTGIPLYFNIPRAVVVPAAEAIAVREARVVLCEYPVNVNIQLAMFFPFSIMDFKQAEKLSSIEAPWGDELSLPEQAYWNVAHIKYPLPIDGCVINI